MRLAAYCSAVLVACFFAIAPAVAEDYGSPDEAKAMTEKAAAFLSANGPQKAFAAFTQGTDGFKDRDLYVFVYNDSGICQAHGGTPALVGKNLLELKDFTGFPIIRKIVAVKDAEWIDYLWKSPASGKVEKKHAYIKRVGDFTLGVGAYLGQAS